MTEKKSVLSVIRADAMTREFGRAINPHCRALMNIAGFAMRYDLDKFKEGMWAVDQIGNVYGYEGYYDPGRDDLILCRLIGVTTVNWWWKAYAPKTRRADGSAIKNSSKASMQDLIALIPRNLIEFN